MPLPAPNLDDRRFQDLLDEARRNIPRFCPEWTDQAVSFATDRDLFIRVPQLAHVVAARGGARFVDYAPALTSAQRGLAVFSDQPRPDDGLYLGFSNDLSSHTLAINLTCRLEGI